MKLSEILGVVSLHLQLDSPNTSGSDVGCDDSLLFWSLPSLQCSWEREETMDLVCQLEKVMDGADASAWLEVLAQQNLSNPDVDGLSKIMVRKAPFMVAFNFQRDLRCVYGM